MRFLVLSAVLACATAVPSGLLAGYSTPYASLGYAPGAGYAHGPALGHGLVAAPTISSGDIQGAAIDAHVGASDHARAAIDHARQYHDQASELQGRAINAAQVNSWQAFDAEKTHEARLDGATAGVAPILAKQLTGHIAPVPFAHAPYAHGYAASALAYAGPEAHSNTVISQSLSQSHPAPLIHAPVLSQAYGAHSLAYGSRGLAYAAQGLAHGVQGLAYGQGVAYGHGLGYGAHGLAHGW